MNKRGIALIIAFIVIVVLTIFGGAVISRSISESWVARRYAESTQAFWLAEAGTNCALKELKLDYTGTYLSSNCTVSSLGQGRYSVDAPENVVKGGQTYKKITAHGFIPATGAARVERVIETLVFKYVTVPDTFYTNAIYCAGDIRSKNNAYGVTGNVTYGGNISYTEGNIEPNPPLHDANITPLALLNFDQIRAISYNQTIIKNGDTYRNYHNATQLSGPFPETFWYNETAGIPNVVFLEGNLDLSGHTTVGGFFVVGGEVLYNATISGNVNVKGSIYTPGQFTIDGGGGALNVDGGVWSGRGTTLNGGAEMAFNGTYMQAISDLDIDTDAQIVAWRDTNSSYNLTE